MQFNLAGHLDSGTALVYFTTCVVLSCLGYFVMSRVIGE